MPPNNLGTLEPQAHGMIAAQAVVLLLACDLKGELTRAAASSTNQRPNRSLPVRPWWQNQSTVREEGRGKRNARQYYFSVRPEGRV